MKKTLMLFLMSLIIILNGLPIGVCAKNFPDVTDEHPNYDAVVSLTDMGVVSGYDDGTFCPGNEITRTEFCALLARALGCDKNSYVVKDVPFSDVKKDYWGVAFISFCYENGLINGMGDGTFAPSEKVTMAQAIKMAVCTIGKENEALSTNGEYWYSGYIEVADQYGLLNLVDNEAVAPGRRAQVAQLVYNVIQSGLIQEKDNSDEIVTENPETVPEENNGQNDAEEPEKEQGDDVGEQESSDNISAEIPAVTIPADLSSGVVITDEEMAKIDKIFSQKDYSQVKVIVLDPGHNYEGKDTGARIEALGVKEEIITWQIADKLRNKLREMGYTVYMTRDKMTDSIDNSSTTASLQSRVNLAHKVTADLFISIHCNMGGGKGSETYCFSKGGYSSRLASIIQKNISKETGMYDRGVKTANFFVIKQTEMPSVLIETAFLDSESDRNILLSDSGQESIAKAIADAVAEYDQMNPIAAADSDVVVSGTAVTVAQSEDDSSDISSEV